VERSPQIAIAAAFPLNNRIPIAIPPTEFIALSGRVVLAVAFRFDSHAEQGGPGAALFQTSGAGSECTSSSSALTDSAS
jgi:hypothetical protein